MMVLQQWRSFLPHLLSASSVTLCSQALEVIHGEPIASTSWILHIGGPQGEVIPQQLHDGSAVFVAVLVEAVHDGHCIIKRCL
eukprot:Skav233505  [mRNA]  locus=scaffold2687:302598:306716:+ [translate_table: standard]